MEADVRVRLTTTWRLLEARKESRYRVGALETYSASQFGSLTLWFDESDESQESLRQLIHTAMQLQEQLQAAKAATPLTATAELSS